MSKGCAELSLSLTAFYTQEIGPHTSPGSAVEMALVAGTGELAPRSPEQHERAGPTPFSALGEWTLYLV